MSVSTTEQAWAKCFACESRPMKGSPHLELSFDNNSLELKIFVCGDCIKDDVFEGVLKSKIDEHVEEQIEETVGRIRNHVEDSLDALSLEDEIKNHILDWDNV